MPNIEELLNPNSVEITKNRTKKLMISKIDFRLCIRPDVTIKRNLSTICLRNNRAKFSRYYWFKKTLKA